MMIASNHRAMARSNRTTALEMVRRCGAVSRVELAERLRLTPASMTRIAGRLLEMGLLRERPTREHSGGRPRTLLEVNPDWGHVVTVSLSHSLDVGVADMAGRLVASECVADAREVPGYTQSFLTALPEAVARLCQEDTSGRILGIGVLSSGRVDGLGNIRYHENIEREKADARAVLASAGLPVFVDEEFRLLIQWHLWSGGETCPKNMVVMSGRLFGTGGGQAALVEGRLCYGGRGLAGQQGKGMALIHGKALLGEMWDLVEGMGGNDRYLDRLLEGDATAARVYRMAVENYGFRLAQVVIHFDPELIVVHSPYVRIEERFMADIASAMRSHLEDFELDRIQLRHGAPRTAELTLRAAAVPILSQVFVKGRFERMPVPAGGAYPAAAAASSA